MAEVEAAPTVPASAVVEPPTVPSTPAGDERPMVERWEDVRDFAWNANAYWEVVQEMLRCKPEGEFFYLAWFALKEKMLMSIHHAIVLCREVARTTDIGADAAKQLEELNDLYSRGETGNRNQQDFTDCGLKVFRDKVLTHPVNVAKAVRGNEAYRISLKWETVEATLLKLREFCKAVEFHNLGQWQLTSHMDGTGEGGKAVEALMADLDRSRQYHQLRIDLFKRGNMPTKVSVDCHPGAKHKIVFVE